MSERTCRVGEYRSNGEPVYCNRRATVEFYARVKGGTARTFRCDEHAKSGMAALVGFKGIRRENIEQKRI